MGEGWCSVAVGALAEDSARGMAGSGATTPTLGEAAALDERDLEPRAPMKRLGSTRKLSAFNSELQLASEHL